MTLLWIGLAVAVVGGFVLGGTALALLVTYKAMVKHRDDATFWKETALSRIEGATSYDAHFGARQLTVLAARCRPDPTTRRGGGEETNTTG